MSWSTVKQLVRYRTLFVALANAGITWIVLIIAPLGLFSVIICTLLIFLTSLGLGSVGDFALFRLLRPSGGTGISGTPLSDSFDTPYPSDASFPEHPRRNLPE